MPANIYSCTVVYSHNCQYDKNNKQDSKGILSVTAHEITNLTSPDNDPIVVAWPTTLRLARWCLPVFLIRPLPADTDGNRTESILQTKEVLVVCKHR